MNQIIIGRGCTFDLDAFKIVIRDPHGDPIGKILFTGGEAAANFASAAQVASSVTFDHEGTFDFAASEGADQ